jgi:PAS domain S-box-containing protein
MYSEPSTEQATLYLRTALSLILIGALCLYLSVALRAGASNRVRIGIVVVFGLLFAAHLASPIGLLMVEVTGTRPIPLPGGATFYQPIGPRSPYLNEVVLPGLFLPIILLARPIFSVWRRGDHFEAVTLAVVLALPTLPAMMAVMYAGPPAVPIVPMSLAATLLVLSVLTSANLARTADMESDLEESEARFRRLVETSPEAIGLYDANRRRFVALNGRFEEILGRPADEILKRDVDDLFRLMSAGPESAGQRARALARRALDGHASTLDLDVTRPDGTSVPCELRLSALDSEEGTLLRVSLLDVSERRRTDRERAHLEARLHRAEKLETLGTLAGGIAHDFNNMITPVVGYGEMAADELDDHPVRAYLDEVLDAADKAHRLTHDILTFSRQAESRTEPIAVQPAIEQACRFLRATLPSRIRVEADLDAPGTRILGDEGQLQQVVMSLGTNAAQAMPKGGTLRVSIRPDGDCVLLEVADTGVGMDSDVVSRMFDPFFTTRETGRASGLGLSVVHGIITSWDGDIDVDTAPGQGTTFRVALPCAAGSPA